MTLKTDVLRAVDKYIFVIISAILGLFTIKRDTIRKEPKEILIIKVWAIGDSVNTLPFIKGIKDKYPKCKITVFTKGSLISVYTQKFIDRIITLDNLSEMLSSFKKYDIVFDLEPYLNLPAIFAWYLGKFRIGFSGQPRSMIYNHTVMFSKENHIVKTYLSMGNILSVRQDVNNLIRLNYSKKSEEKIKAFMRLNHLAGKKIVGICAGVGESIQERAWPKERFKELCERLLEKKNITIILIGLRQEKELNEYIKNGNSRIINTSGELSTEELSCILTKMDIFLSNDTGPMHMAAAQGVRTIGLFGPNTPKIWAPYGKKNVSIFHPKKGCPFLDNTKHNLIPKNLTLSQKTCMDAISVDEVYNSIKRSL